MLWFKEGPLGTFKNLGKHKAKTENVINFHARTIPEPIIK